MTLKDSTAPKPAAAHTPLDLAQFDGHTPGPWSIDGGDTPIIINGSKEGEADIVALIYDDVRDGFHYSHERAEANAKRIVACVNACDGLSIESLLDDAPRKKCLECGTEWSAPVDICPVCGLMIEGVYGAFHNPNDYTEIKRLRAEIQALREALQNLLTAEEEYGDDTNAAINQAWLAASDALKKWEPYTQARAALKVSP